MHHCTIARARAEIGPPKLRAFFGGLHSPSRTEQAHRQPQPPNKSGCGLRGACWAALHPLLGQHASRNPRLHLAPVS